MLIVRLEYSLLGLKWNMFCEIVLGIARQHGGPVPAQQVAFFWAKKLGGDAGVKLLNKLGHAEQALELACEQHAYEFAFDIARLLLKDKLPEVHYKYALHLEDERRYAEAEAEFLKAKKPRDAVLMYVQIKDWDRGKLFYMNIFCHISRLGFSTTNCSS